MLGIIQKTCDLEEAVQLEDGVAAVEAMKESDFDLIMLDWNMPKIQGLDALKAIRASGNTTPVMMVTGSKERTQVMEAFEGVRMTIL